jgi:hypothetical protein
MCFLAIWPFCFRTRFVRHPVGGPCFLLGNKKTGEGAGFCKKKTKFIFEENLIEEEEIQNEQSLGKGVRADFSKAGGRKRLPRSGV